VTCISWEKTYWGDCGPE